MLLKLLLVSTMVATPSISIDSPYGGWNNERIIDVTGHIHDAQKAMLVINGSQRPLQIANDGSYKATFLAPPGSNNITVTAWDKGGKSASKHVSFYVGKTSSLDLVVSLYWDTDKTDIDLHVIEPSQEECFYGHRQTKSGGFLDVDDTDGYGPEVYTLANAPHGSYKVYVKYYSDRGNPQTLASIHVVLYPGTDNEKQAQFEQMLTKTGDKQLVGIFHIDPKGQLIKEQE